MLPGHNEMVDEDHDPEEPGANLLAAPHTAHKVPLKYLVISLIVAAFAFAFAIAATVMGRGLLGETSDASSARNALEMLPQREPDFVIVHFNDVYILKPASDSDGGSAKAAYLMEQVRKRYPNTIVTFGGDLISPSLESAVFQGKQMVDGLNAMNITVACVGNHEFDFGLGILEKRLAESNFPWLCSNFVMTNTTSLLPSVVDDYRMTVQSPSTREKFDVCFFGIMFDIKTSGYKEPRVEYVDFMTVGRRKAAELKRDKGCSIVVALTHQSLMEDCMLAEIGGDIDIILGGHEHATMCSTQCGSSPYFKSTSDFKNLWVLKIWRTKDRIEHIDSWNPAVLPTFPASEQVSLVADYYDSLLSKSLGEVIGETLTSIDVKTVTVRTTEAAIGDFICDGLIAEMQTEISMVNGGCIRSNNVYPKGNVTKGAVISWLPFLNNVVTFKVTGQQLRAHLQWAVSGVPNVLGQFPQIGGFRFTWMQYVDEDAVPSFAIVNLTRVDHTVINDNDEFLMANIDFYKSQSPVFASLPFVMDPNNGPLISTVVEQYISSLPQHKMKPKTDGRIKRETTRRR